MCGVRLSRLCDLNGRHFNQFHPNEKYAPAAPANQPQLFQFVSTIRPTQMQASTLSSLEVTANIPSLATGLISKPSSSALTHNQLSEPISFATADAVQKHETEEYHIRTRTPQPEPSTEQNISELASQIKVVQTQNQQLLHSKICHQSTSLLST